MKQFEKFVGRIVVVEETVYTQGEMSHTFYKIADGDPVVAELKAVAEAEGSKLRIFFPGQKGTLDYDVGRINVMISKDKKTGDYVVKSFHIG